MSQSVTAAALLEQARRYEQLAKKLREAAHAMQATIEGAHSPTNGGADIAPRSRSRMDAFVELLRDQGKVKTKDALSKLNVPRGTFYSWIRKHPELFNAPKEKGGYWTLKS